MANIVLAAAMLLTCLTDATYLTKKSWGQATKGKYVFINFRTKWCEHCQKLEPAWRTLTSEHSSSKDKLIAEVDCNDEKDLCQYYGVHKFPTLKYGQVRNLKDHIGAMDLKALQEFAKAKVGPTCGPHHMDLCDAKQKPLVIHFMDIGPHEISTKIQKMDEFWKEKLDNWQVFVAGQNEQGPSAKAKYEEEAKKMNAAWEEVKESGLDLMKEVRASWKGFEEQESKRVEEALREEL